MTSTEKDRIVQLQRQGYGYKRIAATLGLPVNGVKSFCRRHPMDEVLTPGRCPQCGAMVEQTPGRKPRRFCSVPCREDWWNAHKGMVRRKTYFEAVCPQCGKSFRLYGRKGTYCSRACFADARRKGVSDYG